ncbi:MAG: zinc ribbon domain-containing protein [Acidaminococcaceae bacterium]|nr:zinc ribbon domain-containing protein [Acidaminococcaceae bacterium]
MHKFCPYCGKQITASAIKCNYCGRMLKAGSSKKEADSESGGEVNKAKNSYSTRLLELAKNTILAKSPNRSKQSLVFLLVVASIFAGIMFYTNGPTEYKVAQFSAAHNNKALMQMIDARANSFFFTNVTRVATKAIISLGNKEYINSLAGYLLAKNVKVQQKEAIISAFTASKVLVPNFFEIYDNNRRLQELLQNNGLTVNPNIFKDKILVEGNGILNVCRNAPGDYDTQIDALQIYNVGGLAADNMLQNLKGIADIYAIQRYLIADDNGAILQYLNVLQNQPDVPILAQNSHFFKALEVRVRQRKTASDRIKELSQEIANMHVEDNVQKEEAKIYAAQAQINKTKHIEYFGIKDFKDDALYVSIKNGGWAEIVNPPSETQNFKWYSANVIKTGEIGLTNYYKQWIVPVYQIVDISSAKAAVDKHQSEINKLYNSKAVIEAKIVEVLKTKKQADVASEKLFNNMGAVLNPLTAENVFDFSKNSSHVPLFVQT